MTPEDLLSHTDFMSKLSKSLVRDPSLADDVFQETWLTTVKTPPKSEKNPQSWLSAVMRNKIRMFFRKETRRRGWEHAAAPSEMIPATVDVVAHEEAKRHVVRALSKLKKNYRTILLFRYYKALSYKEIAERLQIPIETVRTRIKRGLAQLREHLDDKYDGNRKAWGVALAPLTGLLPVAKPGKAAVATGASGFFALMFNLKFWLFFTAIAAVSIWIPLLFTNNDSLDNISIASEQMERDSGEAEINRAETKAFAVKEKIEPEVVPPIVAMDPLVTWRGALIDLDSSPIKGVLVQVIEKTEPPVHFHTKTDQNGCFEFKDLNPNDYIVELHVPSPYKGTYRQTFLKWGEIALDKPGLLEQDILIAKGEGAHVNGRVVDKLTNKPHHYENVTLKASWQADFHQQVFGPVDPVSGEFSFRCLPPGKYHLNISGPGAYTGLYSNCFEVHAGQVIDDLVIKTPAFGDLQLHLDGFQDKKKILKETIVICRAEHQWPIGFDNMMEFAGGPVCAGNIIVEARHPELGVVVKALEVKKGETTRLKIHYNEFMKSSDTFTVTGRLCYVKGDPAQDVLFCFMPKDFKGDRSLLKWEWSDTNGEFFNEGFRPGIWHVQAYLYEPGVVAELRANGIPDILPLPMHAAFVDRLILGPDSPNPFHADLVLHTGEVSGVFCDARTGTPLPKMPWKCFADVSHFDAAYRHIRWIFCGQKQDHFLIKGVPPGKYELAVMVPGYMHYYHEPIVISQGQKLNVGKIPLTPSGILDLKVTDIDGNNLNFDIQYASAPPGKDILIKLHLSEDTTRVSGLPTGNVTITILSKGYLSKNLTVTLKHGAPMQREVVLTPDEENIP